MLIKKQGTKEKYSPKEVIKINFNSIKDLI